MAGAGHLGGSLVGRRRADRQRSMRGRPDVQRGAPGGLIDSGAENVAVSREPRRLVMVACET